MTWKPSVSALMIGLVVLSACAPSQSASTGTSRVSTAPAPEKTLTLVIGREPNNWDSSIAGGGGAPTEGGVTNMPPIAHDGLRRLSHTGGFQNLLAAEVPDAAKGTWVINPHNSMKRTWKSGPNAKWPDGPPVTSADFVFAVRLRRDPLAGAGTTGSGSTRNLQSVTALDDHTFVANWSTINIDADQGGGLSPVPRHILASVYEQSPEAAIQNRYFTTEFVGTGPFKQVRWEQGSHQEFARFDDYYRGPAKLNRVILKFVPDPNTQVANILAEAVDVVAPPTIDVEQGLEVKNRWDREGTGHQVLIETRDGTEQWEIMVNPVYARPVNGLTQLPVRQALLQAIDRQELMMTMTSGLGQVALSAYTPQDPYWEYVKDILPQRYAFPHDVRVAQQLLADAGWTKGSDGVLVHSPSGEKFNYEHLARQGAGPFKQASIVADNWKAIGVSLDIKTLTTAQNADNQFLAQRSGTSLITIGAGAYYTRRLHSETIPSDANRWTGNNRGHFNSPVVDRLLETIAVTINDQDRKRLHLELLAETMGKVFIFPYYYVTVPILMLKGVTGPHLVEWGIANNIWEWDKN